MINHLALPAPSKLPKYASVAREAVQQAYGYQSLAEAGDRVETYVQGIANLQDQPAADVAKAALTADRSKSAAWGAALLASCEVLTVPVAGPLSGILAARHGRPSGSRCSRVRRWRRRVRSSWRCPKMATTRFPRLSTRRLSRPFQSRPRPCLPPSTPLSLPPFPPPPTTPPAKCARWTP